MSPMHMRLLCEEVVVRGQAVFDIFHHVTGGAVFDIFHRVADGAGLYADKLQSS